MTYLNPDLTEEEKAELLANGLQPFDYIALHCMGQGIQVQEAQIRLPDGTPGRGYVLLVPFIVEGAMVEFQGKKLVDARGQAQTMGEPKDMPLPPQCRIILNRARLTAQVREQLAAHEGQRLANVLAAVGVSPLRASPDPARD